MAGVSAMRRNARNRICLRRIFYFADIKSNRSLRVQFFHRNAREQRTRNRSVEQEG